MQVYHARLFDFMPRVPNQPYSGDVYLSSGSLWRISGCMPRVREMPFQTCLVNGYDLPTYGARLIDYVKFPELVSGPTMAQAGIGIAAISHHCCDSSFNDADLPAVQYDCLTVTSGLSQIMYGHSTQVENCISSDGQLITMVYTGTGPGGKQDLSGNVQWEGTLSARGGELTLLLSCQSGTEVLFPTYSPPTFLLEWRGCNSGSLQLIPQCVTPFELNFTNIGPLNTCCNCIDSTETGASNVFITANCKPTIYARHIDYQLVDGFTGRCVPVLAMDAACSYDIEPTVNCVSVHCGLIAEITAIDGACACMEGTYNLEYVLTHWEETTPICSALAEITMTCTDNDDGTTTLTMNIACGADNVGTGSVTFESWMMEDLDVTIEELCMTWTGTICAVPCTWQWSEMAMSWSQTSFCEGGCSCDPPSFNGTVDGETTTTECTIGGLPACCVGCVSVRIIRT